MIDAEFRSEERFARLAIAYNTAEEKKRINDTIDKMAAKHDMTPDIHVAQISNGREVIVIEYHDNDDREAGEVFEDIIKALDIKCCS